MSALSHWYSNQYSTWNRTRRLQQAPFLARTDTNTARRAAAMANTPDAVVLNMGDIPQPEQKKQETLFGPNIGIAGGGPEWTEKHQKPMDELTPEVVKTWIMKSKEKNQATTTLQALVNLKRPTLRLSPLEMAPSDDPDHVDSQHHHGLEFEYDCDAPKCDISVHVVLPAGHPLLSEADDRGRVLVFDTVVEGGFGKVLKLEEGAMLELGRLELRPEAPGVKSSMSTQADGDGKSEEAAQDSGASESRNKKRFTNFYFRRRVHERNVAGPALAVVDAEIPTAIVDGDKSKADVEADLGVKVTIQLTALDEAGKELSSPNEQVTYLHIVRMGPPPAPAEGESVLQEDLRPWVVKVVKREATIGPHTFHLHEIFGLSANSTTASHPVAPSAPVIEAHTYPPNTPAPTHEDEPSSECLLCLSSPREVVLLPCRHLVACRECAINMIEFGAGGTIVHADETVPAPPDTSTVAPAPIPENPVPPPSAADNGEAPPGSEASAPQPIPPAPQMITTPRRKRKAKGWFCPVCRQPYTSLLRITTMPPSKDDQSDTRDSTDIVDHVPMPAPISPTVPPSAPASPRSGLGTFSPPNFLRAFSRPAVPQPDLERGQAPTAAA